MVASGGDKRLLNFHLKTIDDPKFGNYREQSYALDIVKLDAFGLRASRLMPDTVTAYLIFGETLYAPCAGSVVHVVDDLPDPEPPAQDREHPAGNHVVLECHGAQVLLAHMTNGSVRVKAGEPIIAGQPIGAVGNSGEPHLHIHAQRPGSAQAPMDGDPLAISFGGRYHVRNDRITVKQARR